MDSNYEAQSQFVRQRLATRREQAEAERLLREGRRGRLGGLKQFLMYLSRRSSRQRGKKHAQEAHSGVLATGRKGDSR